MKESIKISVIILLLLSILSTTNANFLDSISLSHYFTNGTFDREKIVKEAKNFGPRLVGLLLGELVSEDCTIPKHDGDESDSSFDLRVLIPQALHEKVQVEVIDYDVVCLNQGYHKRGHSSASVIVKYSTRDQDGLLSSPVVKQVPLVCFRRRWIAPFTDSGDPVGTLETATRRDCQMCPSPGMFVMTTEAEHCLECPEGCLSRRCRIDGECCKVFDLHHRCASKCPKHSYRDRNRQCRCNRGYKLQRGMCKKAPRRCYCRNGGKCIAGINKCICPTGFSGRYCGRCVLPDCLQCRYDQNAKEAMCVKRKPKERSCRIKFVREPPKFKDLGCSPFDGSGYTLQCMLEVPVDMKDRVKLEWEFTTAGGEVIDLTSPMLSSFLKITRSVSRKNDKVQISSLISANMQQSFGPFGLNIKDMAFQYLKGGSVFCMPKIDGSNEVHMTSNFLMLPLKKPNLEPCSHDSVYSVGSDKCVIYESSTSKPTVSHRLHKNVVRNTSETDGLRRPLDVGAKFEESENKIEGSEIEDEEENPNDYDPGHKPYMIILGTFGGFFLLAGILIPVVGLIALYLKKKYAKPVQPSLSNDEYLEMS